MDDEDDIVEVRALDEFDDLEAELDHNSDEIIMDSSDIREEASEIAIKAIHDGLEFSGSLPTVRRAAIVLIIAGSLLGFWFGVLSIAADPSDILGESNQLLDADQTISGFIITEILDDENGLGWKNIHQYIASPETPIIPKIKTPRPYQDEAIKAAVNHFKDNENSRGRLIMPCGTGKSLLGFWIAQQLNANNILVLVPSLYLINQTLKIWVEEYAAIGIRPNLLAVCSDDNAGNLSYDTFTSYTSDVLVPCETNSKKVAALFNKFDQNSPTLILSTYHSGASLAEACRATGLKFDIAMFDEAHKTVGSSEKTFAHLLYSGNLDADKRMFMTATERVVTSKKDNPIASMTDDSEVYGDRFYQLTFKGAMEDKRYYDEKGNICQGDTGIICDYDVVALEITSEEIKNYWTDNEYLKIDYLKNLELKKSESEIATRFISAVIALETAIKKLGVTKTISFHHSIELAKSFMKQHKLIHQKEDPLSEMTFKHVSSKVSSSEIKIILREFANSNKSLVTNARCLTEGVDIPAVDCVLFADPKKSTVDIVQALGRVLRPSPSVARSLRDQAMLSSPPARGEG